MDKEIKEYAETAKNDLYMALKNDDYEKAMYILNILKEDEIKDLSKEEKQQQIRYGYYMLAEYFDQRDDRIAAKSQLFGIEKSYKKAINLYLKALSMGNYYACSSLYHLHDEMGDKETAEKFLQIGVKAEVPKCCYIYGMRCYKNSDYEQAHKLFQISYEDNPAWGGYELGKMYQKGLSVEKNSKDAFYYFLDAADCGDKLAMQEVGLLYHAEGDYGQAIWYLDQAIRAGITGRKKEIAVDTLVGIIDHLEEKKQDKKL